MSGRSCHWRDNIRVYYQHIGVYCCYIRVCCCNIRVYCCYIRVNIHVKARYTRYKFCIQVSIQENLNSSLCLHDARNVDEYIQVLAGDTTNKMAFLGGEEGAALCIALLCTIVLRGRLSSKKRSTWARKSLRRQRWDVFL
jgi:hypothetical protein